MSVFFLIAVLCGICILLSPDYALARWAAVCLLVALTSLAARYAKVSRTDELTGLGNLRQMKAMERSYKLCREIGVWYFDVDHLKQVNDTEGHSAGDKLLIRFSAQLRGCSAPGARAYRIGGDEFLLIVPQPTGDPVPPLPDVFGLPASWGYAAGPGGRIREWISLAEEDMYQRRRSRVSPNVKDQ